LTTSTDVLPDNQQNKQVKYCRTTYRQDLVQNLPLTPVLLAQSNKRMYDAYLDIANFYRDVLDDKKEAIAAYELLLSRFPNNDNKLLYIITCTACIAKAMRRYQINIKTWW
jgi:hypothetical protein